MTTTIPKRIRKQMAAAVADPTINTTNMSATFTISTPTPDRSGDVVEPQGVVLDNYKNNPICYFDHGLSGIQLPIGKSEGPDGFLEVYAGNDGVDATCFFAQGMREACQIFELVEQRILRSASINFGPLDVEPIRNGGLHIREWELYEWSIVGIPDNPEALRKCLDRGKLAGSSICPSIRDSLVKYAAKAKREQKAAEPWVRPPGWEVERLHRQMKGRAVGTVERLGLEGAKRYLTDHLSKVAACGRRLAATTRNLTDYQRQACEKEIRGAMGSYDEMIVEGEELGKMIVKRMEQR